MRFSNDIANLILSKINRKGWNIYNSDNVAKIGTREVIRRNLSTNLEKGVFYVLLPKIDDSTNPHKVLKTQEDISRYLPSKFPDIYIDLKFQPFLGFMLEENNVKVMTKKGNTITYDNFIYYLEDITRLNIKQQF